jgi:hypothetical protein
VAGKAAAGTTALDKTAHRVVVVVAVILTVVADQSIPDLELPDKDSQAAAENDLTPAVIIVTGVVVVVEQAE